MSDKEYNFQSELEKSILNADIKLNRSELLIDIFKAYIAKLMEKMLIHGRIPFEAVVQIKRNLINEFRSALLAEYQMSVEQYEKLFDETVKEILNYASNLHKGHDTAVQSDQELIINPEAYIQENGIFKPSVN